MTTKEGVFVHIPMPLMAEARRLSRQSGFSLSQMAERGLKEQCERLSKVLAGMADKKTE